MVFAGVIGDGLVKEGRLFGDWPNGWALLESGLVKEAFVVALLESGLVKGMCCGAIGEWAGKRNVLLNASNEK